MEQLNPMDAQFVDAEDQDRHASFAIASVSVLEGPAPSYDEFLDTVAARLPLVPLYRRKLRKVPFRLGPPVWVDDPNFDLRYHIRQTALPAPGSDEQLSNLMARVMAQRLDRDYPLWEYWLVEGLSRGRWALISKVHHSMVDGVSATDLYQVIFDTTPEPSPPVADRRSAAPPEPSSLSLATLAAVDMMFQPSQAAIALGRALAHPEDAARQASNVLRAVAKLATSAWPATESSLSGAIGRQRRYTWARASLDDVKTIKRALGGTVNDVVLAAISGGYRDLLLARGEHPEPHMVPSLVPVSLRAAGEESIYENRLSVVLADLPVHLADPVERFTAVQAELSALKQSKEATVGEALVALGRFTPYPIASLAVRLAYRLPQREIVTVTTNVPGPRQPLYALGRKLVEIIPYVPIATTLRTGVSIFSYCDTMTFGITGDYGTTPDLDVLACGIERGVAELYEAAQRHPVTSKRGPRAAKSPAAATEPRARSAKPRAGSAKPRAGSAKPRAGSAKPRAEAAEPVMVEAMPVVEETVLVAGEAMPVTEGAKPVVEETVPVGEAMPLVEEAMPLVEEAMPVVEEAKPVVEEAKPVAGEARPRSGKAKPRARPGKPRTGATERRAGAGGRRAETAARHPGDGQA